MNSANLRAFFIAFVASMPFWWGMDVFADSTRSFFEWRALASTPSLLLAQAAGDKLADEVRAQRPIRKPSSASFATPARGAFAIFLSNEGRQKILFEQESTRAFPIASLTKLMTAFVVLERYPLEQSVREGASGDVFSVRDLLYPMLIESSNEAATALANMAGSGAFVALMNEEARNIGMTETRFVNPTGLDGESSFALYNRASARDIALLIQTLLQKYPQIFDILSLKEFNLYRADGTFHHTLRNTNELLEYAEWPTNIVGGKTGFTLQAKGCLALVIRSPKDKGYLVTVVLGSDDRFEETKRMIDWALYSHWW